MKPKAEIPVMEVVPVGCDISGLANPTYKGLPAYTGAWKDCAYDPELPGPIYHTDQVRVPSTLQDVVRDWTKAVVRENPENLNEWSRQWFANRVAANQPAPAPAAEADEEMHAAAAKVQAVNRGRAARKGK